MNLTVEQSINLAVYLENDYQGSLSQSDLTAIESIDWSGWFQTWFGSLSITDKLPQDCELSLRLTGDRQIQTFNHQYRAQDKPTDVLAFAATEADLILPSDLDEPLYLGDIIISLDTAFKQAKEQKHSLIVELAWLGSHGLLHLLGWDHPDDQSLRLMLDRQSKLIQSILSQNAE